MLVEVCVKWRWQDGIRRADVTCYHDRGSPLSVCGDGWFILGAMIALHHRCAAPPSQSNQPSEAVNQLSTTHTLHDDLCLRTQAAYYRLPFF